MVPGPDGRLISTQERMDNVRGGQVQQNGTYTNTSTCYQKQGLLVPVFLYLCCFRCTVIILLKAGNHRDKAGHILNYGKAKVELCF